MVDARVATAEDEAPLCFDGAAAAMVRMIHARQELINGLILGQIIFHRKGQSLLFQMDWREEPEKIK
ncbi:MAG: hypothetical protein H6637_05320 [Ardenticatenales bacterium]|nr:hypothetical protein [Ardenticatenales bacterium]